MLLARSSQGDHANEANQACFWCNPSRESSLLLVQSLTRIKLASGAIPTRTSGTAHAHGTAQRGTAHRPRHYVGLSGPVRAASPGEGGGQGSP
jgi:hypothetical protein